MSGYTVTRDAFRLMALVPEDLVSLPADDESDQGPAGGSGQGAANGNLGDGEWAAWLASTPVDGRNAVVLVSITVTALASAGDALVARVRARYPGEGALVEEFTTHDGNRALGVRRVVTKKVRGRDVTTGQVQALVAYPAPGALGVVSAVALNPDDLDRAAALVTGIATGMTVTSAPAAALGRAAGPRTSLRAHRQAGGRLAGQKGPRPGR